MTSTSAPYRTGPRQRPTRRVPRPTSWRHRLAAEDRPGYGPVDPADGTAGPDASGASSRRRRQLTAAAAGTARETVGELPGLDGCAEVEEVLDLALAVDRCVAALVDRAIDLHVSGTIEESTGVPVDHWLTLVARRTGSDVRMLGLAVDLLPLLPTVHDAFVDGRLSWSQVRAVLLEVRRLPARLLDEADAVVGQWLTIAPAPDPDTVTRGLGRLAWQFDTERADRQLRREETSANFVGLQPRLDDSGGRGWFDLDAPSFAVVQAALDTGTVPVAGGGTFTDPGDRELQVATLGTARASRLLGWAHRHLDELAIATGRAALLPAPSAAGDRDEGAALVGAGATASEGRLPASSRLGALPGLLLRVPLDTILGGMLPGDLLTSLTGGKLRVSARTARRLLDAGVDLRTVVMDTTGSVVGVGTATRRPPGWLSDAMLALNATCTAPGCNAPARTGQADHARPVTSRDGGPSGATDIANLQPLCTRHNRTKEPDGWTATGRADGTRAWRHARSGITTTHLPDHWQPTLPDGTDVSSGGGRDGPHRDASGEASSTAVLGVAPPGDPPEAPPRTPPPLRGPTVADLHDRTVDPDVPF